VLWTLAFDDRSSFRTAFLGLTGRRALAHAGGFRGFAVGRTRWWDALRGHLDGALSASDAEARIAAGSRRLMDAYLLAAR
jgi:myo-inositol catabolism protein IolC